MGRRDVDGTVEVGEGVLLLGERVGGGKGEGEDSSRAAKDGGGAKSEATKTATGARSEATKCSEHCAFYARGLYGT